MLTASARALWPFFVRADPRRRRRIARASRRSAQRRLPLQDADHSPAMIAVVHILSFGPRGRLPAGAWLSGVTRARGAART